MCNRWIRWSLIFSSLFLPSFSYAEQLPIRVWTTADGLPHNHINRIKRDTRGYLWIGTDEGLARFDGYRFINYGTAQGLPNLTVNDFLEARDGTYWVATDGGVCLFNPLGKAAQPAQPMFTVYRVSEQGVANHVNGLLEENDGSLWLATSGGLFHFRRANGQVRIEAVDIGYPPGMRDERHITKLYLDSRGTLWVMAISGLYRRTPNGSWERYSVANGLRDSFVQSMFEDRHGRLWLGSRSEGLYLLVAEPKAGQGIVEKTYSIREGLPGIDVRSINTLPDGRVWLCVVGGLVLFNPEASDDRKFVHYTTAQGLATTEIYSLIQDSEGNLWIGTRNNGVMRIAGSGFTTFGAQDGFTPATFNTMREANTGELLIHNGARRDQRFFHYFDGRKFVGAEHKVAAGFGFGREQSVLQDRFGEWWVGTAEGVHRYPNVKTVATLARAKPKAIYGSQNGLAHHNVERLFEDQRGDIWIGTSASSEELIFLHRWERATNKIYRYKLPDDVAPTVNLSAIGEDAQGNLWLANSGAPGLTRYRDGQFKRFTAADGAPPSTTNAFFLDSKKRLWIATSSSGLHRLDELSADRMRLTTWDVTKGLATNEVWSITEDQWGRIYAGTGRGIDRLDPATGYIRHFSSDDGLAKGEVRISLRDRHNQLWFVTEQGVSRLVPTLEKASSSLPVLITALRVNGNPTPLSELGEGKLENLVFAPDQNSLQIDFLSLDFSVSAKLHYQYHLNAQEWSVASDLRTVNFANLAPGVYHFGVRTIDSSGIISDAPAIVAFTINRSLWQRWWFLSLLSLSLGGLIYSAYRYRVAQLLALERVRLRIASDLHDDVGANLSLIAGISEMLEQQSAQAAPQLRSQLAIVAQASRRSMDAMGDIVWMINPHKDQLRDLTQRIRRFASDTLAPRNIAVKFSLPDGEVDMPISSESRREIFLICKEAVNNIARHSSCNEAEITLTLVGHEMTLHVRDNGQGFGPTAMNGNGGQGMISMRSRAQKLGGELSVTSQLGGSTEIVLRARLLT